MRFLLLFVILVHGLIHLMGFAKAFQFAELAQLAVQPSRAAGMLWLGGALAFGAAGALLVLQHPAWWRVTLAAVALSQALIFVFWRDAKFGSLANVVVVLSIVALGFR